MKALSNLTQTEIEDLKYILSKKFSFESERPELYVRNTSTYKKENSDETFTHTIECSFGLLRYYIYFRELEVSSLGYSSTFRDFQTETLTDPVIIERIKSREKLITEEIKKYLL